jgi:hypothetical protein
MFFTAAIQLAWRECRVGRVGRGAMMVTLKVDQTHPLCPVTSTHHPYRFRPFVALGGRSRAVDPGRRRNA